MKTQIITLLLLAFGVFSASAVKLTDGLFATHPDLRGYWSHYTKPVTPGNRSLFPGKEGKQAASLMCEFVQAEQLHLKVPSYKEEYVDGYGGWHIERGGPPKPTGAVWLRLSARKTTKDGKDLCMPIIEAIRAK